MEKEQYEILYRLEESHWWYLGMQRIVGSMLERHLNPADRPRILDAGCGTGGMLSYLSRFGPTVGIDIADEAVSLAHRRGLDRVARASVEEVPFATSSFDLLVSFDVLYHQAVVDDRKALREFHRVLRPGGLLVVRVPAYNWLRGAHDLAVHTRHRYSAPELGHKLQDAGFSLQKLTHVNSLLFPIAAMKRMMEGKHRPLMMDLELPPAPINSLLYGVLKLESALLPAISFPWGLSVLALARKTGECPQPVSEGGSRIARRTG
jgi:SAM-dependent methyltransferase